MCNQGPVLTFISTGVFTYEDVMEHNCKQWGVTSILHDSSNVVCLEGMVFGDIHTFFSFMLEKIDTTPMSVQ